MEEVDEIIIHTLRSVGCDIGEDVVSLHQFNTELIVEATARCIGVITPEQDVPTKLPPSMSAKFRVGTALATALQGMGYRGEIGYQTFLYSNEADIRKVFIFLVEKLPKESSDSTEEPLGSSALLQRGIGAELSKRLQSPWTPAFCKQGGVCWRGQPPTWQREGCSSVHSHQASPLVAPHGLHDLKNKITKECRQYYKKQLPYLSEQPRHHYQLAASILQANARSYTAQQQWDNEWNQLGLASRLTPQEYKARKRAKIAGRIRDHIRDNAAAAASKKQGAGEELAAMLTNMMETAAGQRTKGSRFTQIEKLQFAKDENKVGEAVKIDTEEELQKKREEETGELKSQVDGLTSQLDKLTLQIRKMTAATQQMEEDAAKLEKNNQQKEETYKVKKRSAGLLPEAEENMGKLQTVVDNTSEKLVKLAQQWEEHRKPLIEQYRQLRILNDNKVDESEKKLELIADLREKMKEVSGDSRNKDELHKQLVSEYERMTKDVSRSAYTKRIMEIVGNIKKQKQEIDKVLVDTKSIQKEINQLNGKLDRTFTVTDELIFRDAKRDESVRQAYKYLAGLHENCNSIINTVEETGVIMREIRDLEDQIDQEMSKKIEANLEKISEDYQAMKKENSGYLQKLKKIHAGEGS